VGVVGLLITTLGLALVVVAALQTHYLLLMGLPVAVVSGLVAEDATKPQVSYSFSNGNHHEKLRNH
jgi:hypothetical protein